MAYQSGYDPTREADLSKQSARGKRIARRGKDIKDFRASLPRSADPENFWTFKQKEYDYSPNWRDVGTEQLRKRPGGDAKEGWFGGLGRNTSTANVLREKIWKKKGDRDYDERWDVKLGKNISGMGGDLFIDPIKKGIAGFKLPSWMTMDAVSSNWQQNKENERILGDDYTDEVRKAMMTPRDREGYEKAKTDYENAPTGNPGDSERKEEYKRAMDSAFRNAQVTRRVNYALGEEPFGFDTSATAGVANVDYGELSGMLRSGLEGTDAGKSFLKKHAVPKTGDTDYMKRVISDFNQSDLKSRPELVASGSGYTVEELERFHNPLWLQDEDFYGGRSPIDEIYASQFPRRQNISGMTFDPLSRQYSKMKMAGLINPWEEEEDIISRVTDDYDDTGILDWSIYDTFPQLDFIKNPSVLPQNLDTPLEEMTQQEAALWAEKNPYAAMNLGWSPYQ